MTTHSCPKRMTMGPCGGVRSGGGCEVGDFPCVFDDVPAWPGPEGMRREVDVPLVLADFTSEPFDRATHDEVAGVLAGAVDAVLVGEHQNRPDYPPTQFAHLLRGHGLRPWITLTCRDRNRVVLEQELTGLREAGAEAVLCVTGDARAPGVRPGVTQVFDLDGPRLAALAAGLGLVAAVPETPAAPPVDRRAFRLLQKQRAGASVAVLNYTPPARAGEFLASARALGVTIPVIAGLPVYTDARSAAVLDALPGLDLDHDAVRAVTGAADPVEAGIAAAVAEGLRLLAVPGVVGLNLSGSASERGYGEGAAVKAEVAARLRLATAGAG